MVGRVEKNFAYQDPVARLLRSWALSLPQVMDFILYLQLAQCPTGVNNSDYP